MLRVASTYIILCAAVFAALSGLERHRAHAGLQTLLGVGAPTTTVVGFQGLGDVVASPLIYLGLRAMSAATTATKSANICNTADISCADINTLANGDFDVATAQGAPLNCGGVGGTCTIKTVYDKGTGSGCSPCDVTNATIANRPTLSFNCVGTKACMTFTSAQRLSFAASGSNTGSQPFSYSAVLKQTSSAAQGTFFSCGSGGLFGFTTAPAMVIFNGSNFTFGTTLNTLYRAQVVSNSTSSVLYINGTSHTGDSGTTACLGAGQPLFLGSDKFSQNFVGQGYEIAMWALALNGTQDSSLESNQLGYWQ